MYTCVKSVLEVIKGRMLVILCSDYMLVKSIQFFGMTHVQFEAALDVEIERELSPSSSGASNIF
jgi:hypothetical protein